MSNKTGAAPALTEDEIWAQEMADDGLGDAAPAQPPAGDDTDDLGEPEKHPDDAEAPAGASDAPEGAQGAAEDDQDRDPDTGRYIPKVRQRAPKAKAKAEDDIDLSSLPEDLRARLKARNNEYERQLRAFKGDEGRVQQLRQQLAEAQTRLAQLEAGQRTPAAPATSGASGSDAAPSTSSTLPDAFASADFRNMEQDFPDIAKFFKDTIGQLYGRLEQSNQVIEQLRGEFPKLVDTRVGALESVARRASVDALTTRHPDWQEHLSFVPYNDTDERGRSVRAFRMQMSPRFEVFWASEAADEFRADRRWNDLGYSTAVMDAFKDYWHERDNSDAASASARAGQDRQNRRMNGLRAAAPPTIRGRTGSVARVDPNALSDDEAFLDEMRRDD